MEGETHEVRPVTPWDDAVAFFYDNAGSSYRPAVETEGAGRLRGARDLAEAEQWAKDVRLTFAWEPDGAVGDHAKEYGETYAEGGPETCERVTALSFSGRALAALGCVDDASAEYRRVVEAELASEARQFSSRFNGREWTLFSAGQCCYQTGYGLPGQTYCGKQSDPRSAMGYCAEHQDETTAAPIGNSGAN